MELIDWKQLYNSGSYTSVIQDGDVFMLGRPDVHLGPGYRTLAISKEDLRGQLGEKIMSVKIPLSTAQIKTGNSVPILALPAPGIGKVIEFVGGFVNCKYGTQTFDSTSVYLTCGTNLNRFAECDNVFNIANSTNQIFGGVVGTNDSQYAENKPVYILLDTDSVHGNGTGAVYITYKITNL